MPIFTTTFNNSKRDFIDMDTTLSEIKNYVDTSAKKGTPAHEVEKQLLKQVSLRKLET